MKTARKKAGPRSFSEAVAAAQEAARNENSEDESIYSEVSAEDDPVSRGDGGGGGDDGVVAEQRMMQDELVQARARIAELELQQQQQQQQQFEAAGPRQRRTTQQPQRPALVRPAVDRAAARDDHRRDVRAAKTVQREWRRRRAGRGHRRQERAPLSWIEAKFGISDQTFCLGGVVLLVLYPSVPGRQIVHLVATVFLVALACSFTGRGRWGRRRGLAEVHRLDRDGNVIVEEGTGPGGYGYGGVGLRPEPVRRAHPVGGEGFFRRLLFIERLRRFGAHWD